MISFVVPNINNVSLLSDFLTKFKEAAYTFGEVPLTFEVVVVDNGSKAQTQKALDSWESLYSWLRVIRNSENKGFGPACNQGAKATMNDVLVFTQTDVEIADVRTLISLVGCAKQGVLYGARLIDWDSGWNYGIPYLEGWFLACTRGTWEMLGGFDERYYPADYEDIDLALTAKREKVPLIAVMFPVKHNTMGGAGWNQFEGRLANTKLQQQRFLDKWFGGRPPK